jgi:hypothetical protein
MKKTAPLALVFVCVSWPLMAKSHHFDSGDRHRSHHESHRYGHHEGRHHAYDHDRYRHNSEPQGVGETHSHITCDMVRSYVAQVGLAQARAMAHAAGMTASEERRARQCLASGA